MLVLYPPPSVLAAWQSNTTPLVKTPADVGSVSLPTGSSACSVTLNSNQLVLLVPPVILKETFLLLVESLSLILPPLALKASSTFA